MWVMFKSTKTLVKEINSKLYGTKDECIIRMWGRDVWEVVIQPRGGGPGVSFSSSKLRTAVERVHEYTIKD